MPGARKPERARARRDGQWAKLAKLTHERIERNLETGEEDHPTEREINRARAWLERKLDKDEWDALVARCGEHDDGAQSSSTAAAAASSAGPTADAPDRGGTAKRSRHDGGSSSSSSTSAWTSAADGADTADRPIGRDP